MNFALPINEWREKPKSRSNMFKRIAVVTVVLSTAICSVLFPIPSAINFYDQTEPAAARSALAFSTCFGGGRKDWREQTYGAGIAVDKQGYVYIIGKTGARDYPSVNPAQKQFGGVGDAFIAKFTPDGQKRKVEVRPLFA
jgi:hypothetical protein